MKIAVACAGRIRGAFALRWKVAPGICLHQGGDDPKHRPLKEAGFTLVPIADAVVRADAVLRAIPFAALKYTAKSLGNLGGRTIVDRPDALGGILKFPSTAEAVRSWSESSRVVKAPQHYRGWPHT